MSATRFEIERPTSLRAEFPAFDTEGQRSLSMATEGSELSLDDAVLVKAPPDLVYGDIDLGEEVSDFTSIHCETPSSWPAARADVVVNPRLGSTDELHVFSTDNLTFNPGGVTANSTLVQTSRLRDVAYIFSGVDIPGVFNGYYDAHRGEFVALSLPEDRDGVFANRLAMSHDAERFYLFDGIYDRNFEPLGSITDEDVINYGVALSPDGATAYWIEHSTGLAHAYDIAQAPFTKLGTTDLQRTSYGNFATELTPDGGAMILARGRINASSPDTHLIVLPLP